MFDSVHYERSNETATPIVNTTSTSISISDTSTTSSNEQGAVGGSKNTAHDEPQGNGNVLCSHDGVLLIKANAEYIEYLNTSGALAIVEYTQPRRRLYIEWRPNENILIADDVPDQGDWALVDTISRRTRTSSECKVFNTKPAASGTKPRLMRTWLEELACLEVRRRGQVLRFFRKSDGNIHSEFFFQHGNADLFVRSMCAFHIIDRSTTTRNGEEYIILTNESQKLKKTFAELDIGEIKASTMPNDSWLPSKVIEFLVNFPDYVTPPHRSLPKQRPASVSCRSLNTSADENYQMISHNNSANQSGADKSPIESELENVREEEDDEEDDKAENALPKRQTVTRGMPLSEEQWSAFCTPDGRISDEKRIREIVFRGGIEPKLRNKVWKYLLDYYQWDDTELERSEKRMQKIAEYETMKTQWKSMTATQEENFTGYRDRKVQIEKDVKRTDRTQEFFAGDDNPNLILLQEILMTYVMYNFDLGYVQGMSDLLAPILEIQQNDADAFWCFVGFMNLMYSNFTMDQASIKTQFRQLSRLMDFTNRRLFKYMLKHESQNMFFCFRWLLVWYKREFSTDDVFKLWECLWTRLPCPNFHLFISLAILDEHTETIINNRYEFAAILKFINELSGVIDVNHTLAMAEAIYLQIKSANNIPKDIQEIIVESPMKKPPSDEFDDEACELGTFLHYT